jgi:hypothetical protein
MQGIEVNRRARLQIHRLPDPLGGAVSLFALELERVRRIIHAQDELLFLAPPHLRRQLEFERSVTAAVFAQACPSSHPCVSQSQAPTTRKMRLPCHASGTVTAPAIPANVRLIVDA